MSIDFLSLTAPGVAGLHPYQPGKPVDELEREYGVTDAIKLASNENPLGPGKRALIAMRECEPGSGLYPDGNGFALKQLLAHQLSKKKGQNTHEITPENITLGNGSSEILELVARTFVQPDDQIIFSEYAFAVYPILTQAVGARAVITPAKNWGHDLDAMTAAMTERTRLIFVANPNNPTGNWLNASELYQFLSSLPDSVIVIIDEAYFEYAHDYFEGDDYPDAIAWIHAFPNMVVTRTFSKIHGLAGLRIGYGVSHPEVANLLNRVRQPFNCNAIALAAAEAALQDSEHIEASVAINAAGMKQLLAAFDSLGLSYLPSVGNFICAEFECPAIEVYEALLKKGVIVRPIAVYGMPHHLRITIGTEKENARFIQALTEILQP